jgi:hypothetical protein
MLLAAHSSTVLYRKNIPWFVDSPRCTRNGIFLKSMHIFEFSRAIAFALAELSLNCQPGDPISLRHPKSCKSLEAAVSLIL